LTICPAGLIIKLEVIMQKKDIIDLIQYHVDKDESAFRNKAYDVAGYFDRIGDHQLSEYVMMLLADANSFTTQMDSFEVRFLKRAEMRQNTLPLPEVIAKEVIGVVNAINRRVGIHKVLLEGAPGTGKTETAYSIAKILDRELYLVDFSDIVDSKLGQTAKNLTQMFSELRYLGQPQRGVILFDEIDAIALDRINSNDLREMGRVTSTLIKELDGLNEDIVCLATTNLFRNIDKAITRRFDAVICFDRYSKEDLVDVGVYSFNNFLPKFDNISKDTRLIRKILRSVDELPMPGDLTNMIKTSLAFSNPQDPCDYLRRLYMKLHMTQNINMSTLKAQGFTVREIGELVGSSKTWVSKKLNGGINE